ncbi:serine/threonine-protein kinase 10-A-like isoform X2 [Lineus longissimus]|uniref:serine/threonine-protein kinase 10-A-like isoform X2 n=1 Tax=Lineus longissimus TaxID=88925 RepID=UPI00315CBE65
MSFLSNVRKFFRIGDVEKKKKTYNNIRRDRDPSEIWEIVGELGDGAFGKVYKTKNKEDGSFAALKQVEIKDEEELDDYMVEIDILTEFKHKNVVGLYEAFFYNETLWMYIEFCGGGALDSIMMELEKPLTEPQIRCICHEMCEALAFLHQCGVIHRDLKAGNVLLAMDGTVRLADFGVSAKNGDPKAKRDTFIGTPFWMAPEVISCETLKENPYDSSADIWSFGITLIELAQMEPPNHEMHPMRVLMKIHKADPPTLDVQSKWSKDFNDFIRICLNKTPEGRPTASDLLKHPFIKNVTDNRPVRELIGEAKAEITEVFEDIPDETEVKVNGIDLDAEGSEDSYSMGDISESLGEHPATDRQVSQNSVKSIPSIKEEEIPEPEPEPKPVPEPEVEEEDEPLYEVLEVGPSTPTGERKTMVFPAAPEPEEVDEPIYEVLEVEDGKMEPHLPENDVPNKREEPASPCGVVVTTPVEDNGPANIAGEVHILPPGDEILTPGHEDVTSTKDDEILPSSEISDSAISMSESPGRQPQTDDELPDDKEDIDSSPVEERKEPSVPATDAIDGSLDHDALVDSLKKVTEDDGDKTSIKEETITMGDEDKEEEKPDAPVAVAVVAPPEPDEVREDVVEDVVTEIVDDVIRSDQDVPSVPQVVMESFDELVQEDINAQKQNNEEPSEPVQDTDLLVTDIDTEITKLQDGEDRSEEVKVVVPSVIVTPDQPREEVHKPSTPQLDRLSNEQKSDSGSQETISSAGDTMIVVDDRQPKEQNAVTRRKDKNEQQKKEVKVSFGIALPHKTPTMQAKSQYRTLTKTRKYIVDGVIVTSTTSKVVLVGEENRTKEEFENKKQDLRELKVLQKQENKAYQDLVLKAQYMRQQEERRYDLEMQALLRSFEADIEALNKQQKQQVEKAEITQGLDLKLASKKIKQDQDREVRMFHETLKQEQKLLKQEVDMMPKDQRKDVLRRRREEKDIEHQERERHFLEQQQESFDKKMKRLSDQHREKIALLEKQFLQQKQQLLRAREAAIWEMEERHQHEKHQLAKRQLKDMFFLKRHQMLTRHDKELAQIKRINGRKEEELLRRQAIEKKRMPKIQKGEMKTRAQIFKQSLRISMVINADEERDKIRQFEENEKKRVKAEQLRQELKHKKQWDELTNKNMTQLRELEQLQAEKRKMLMEQETQKIQELDDHYENELVEWRSKLQPRKQKLENALVSNSDIDKFLHSDNTDALTSQSKFYVAHR